MSVPQIAIVGRPNVGKSSLFNWLARRRIAIVDPTPGVTRDRLVSPIIIGDRYVEIVDTGGMGIVDKDNLTEHVERQIDEALARASVILFVVDARAGLVSLDEDVAERLRPVTKPILLVVNKCDHEKLIPHATEFHRLGPWDLIPVSARENRGRDMLLEHIARSLPPESEIVAASEEQPLKIALVGRRNTGKSTFINSLAQSERTIVSEVPGTTRDSVDVVFERDGKQVIAIDTAGVRKRVSVKTDVEFYSLHRAERSIRRADVVLMFLDAPKNISMVDKHLAAYILENYKPAIFVVNKWDLMTELPTGEFGEYVRKVFPSLDYLPIAFVTAKKGRNVLTVLNLARNLHKQAGVRVGTGDLNRVLKKALESQPPPSRQNRQPRIYFATQVATNPPTLVLFTNGPQLFDNTYQRYLLKTFRDHLPFKDVPIKMYFRHKRREDAEDTPSPPHARGKDAKRSKKSATKKAEVWKD